MGRVTSEILDHFDDTLDQTESFVYDLASNRVSRTVDKGNPVDEVFTYDYDANDRLVEELVDDDGTLGTDRTITYGYDRTQQTSKITSESGTDITRITNTYDLQGRLEQVLTETLDTDGTSVTSRNRITYEYDSQGIRITSLDETDTDTQTDDTFETRRETTFLVDHHSHTGHAQTIEETVTDADSGNTVSKKIYVFGHDEITQTTYEYDANGMQTGETTHTFAHDGHGSVRVLLEASQAIAQVFTYSAYGQLLAIHNAALASDTSPPLTNLLYSGEYFDAKTGQQYLRARWYDPNTGRFNRLDPHAGDMNDPLSLHKYLYTHANPIMGIDPTGEFFSILLGSLFDANMQTMAVNAYEAAFDSAKIGLKAMDSYYNMKILRALSYDPFPSGWTKTALSVLPILNLIREDGGPSMGISQILNMTSSDWDVWILKNIGDVPPPVQPSTTPGSTFGARMGVASSGVARSPSLITGKITTARAGTAGERLACAWLKKKGYSNILALQNASGHGLDIVAQNKRGQWRVFEVKGHIGKGYAKLSTLQQQGPMIYTRRIVDRILAGEGHWALHNTTESVLEVAEKIDDYLFSGKKVRGMVFNVDYALDMSVGAQNRPRKGA